MFLSSLSIYLVSFFLLYGGRDSLGFGNRPQLYLGMQCSKAALFIVVIARGFNNPFLPRNCLQTRVMNETRTSDQKECTMCTTPPVSFVPLRSDSHGRRRKKEKERLSLAKRPKRGCCGGGKRKKERKGEKTNGPFPPSFLFCCGYYYTLMRKGGGGGGRDLKGKAAAATRVK